jgi:group II intron reverse transcriptase/maturase
MSENFERENRESLPASRPEDLERSENAQCGNADTHVGRQSDDDIVPTKLTNNDAAEASKESDKPPSWRQAELMEGRSSAEWNTAEDALYGTPSPSEYRSSGLDSVREAARKDRTLKFTALLHHVNESALTEAYYELKRNAAVGVDEVTWGEYGENLEANIRDLHGRVHRGAYRAKPSRRSWIPKPDGRLRPLGIPALEDKIVQQAVLWVIQAIYEQDFLGFSYGFRPNRSCHHALDALTVGLTKRKVSWVLDADIEGFFDAIDHGWMINFLEHRIGDRRILRLIRKWLRAGVSEDGEWSETKVGTPQGGVISPILANVFLHYVFDLWIEWWRKNRCRGDCIVIRYADDFVIGFQYQYEAIACLDALRARFAKFGLKLHEGKTRLIEFGRFAADNREKRGAGKPETFNFLGFTHVCAKTWSQGWFTIHRYSMAKRITAKLREIRDKLRRRMHEPVGMTGKWLRQVVRGWLNYHAVPHNSKRIEQFVHAVTRLWLRMLRRRSQRGRKGWNWERMGRLADRYLPKPRIIHDYPLTRFRARHKAGAV